MSTRTCPECGGELHYDLNGWHCKTSACAEKRIEAWLFQLRLSATLQRDKALVDKMRREAEEMADGYAADLEREDGTG